MGIRFYTYVGEAGDLCEMLVGVRLEDNYKISRLYNRSFFRLWNLRRAKRAIMKEFEILTGRKPIEA